MSGREGEQPAPVAAAGASPDSAPATQTQVRMKMMPSAVATSAALELCPDGNDPKSGFTRMSSGRSRPTSTLMSRVTAALAIAAVTSLIAPHGRRKSSRAPMVTAGTTRFDRMPPPTALKTRAGTVSHSARFATIPAMNSISNPNGLSLSR